MKLLSHPCAHELRRIVFEHGRDWQRDLWMNHLENAPRYEPDRTKNPCPAPDPWPDDGQGPAPRELCTALLGCLYLEAGRMLQEMWNPATSEDDAADLGNDYAEVRGLIDWISGWLDAAAAQSQ